MKIYPSMMIDLETFGTTADSVILSIGAVKFNPVTGEIADTAFYRSVSLDSNLDAGRRIDESTLIWWLGQSNEAQQVFKEAKISLSAALEELTDFFDHDDYEVWSNGADFDIPMLAHAFRSISTDIPWKFWKTRCFRTMKNLPFAVGTEVPHHLKHNALDDAYTQVNQLINIWKRMNMEVVCP